VEGDIDLTVVMGKEWDCSVDLLEALRNKLERSKDKLKILWVNYVDTAEVKVLKLNIDGLNVDITFKKIWKFFGITFS